MLLLGQGGLYVFLIRTLHLHVTFAHYCSITAKTLLQIIAWQLLLLLRSCRLINPYQTALASELIQTEVS